MPDLREESWDDDEPFEAPSRPVNGHALHAPAADPVAAQWARFRDRFADAMTDGLWTVEDLEEKVLAHRAFFFPGVNAAMAAEIQIFPSGRQVFQVTWAVGEAAELIGMAPGVIALARTLGCHSILVEGRPAWVRLLAPMGFEPFSMASLKEL
jgi:hypothetical protein